jgi:hypothetical protein
MVKKKKSNIKNYHREKLKIDVPCFKGTASEKKKNYVVSSGVINKEGKKN